MEESQAIAPHLGDMRMGYDEAIDLAAEAAMRFEDADTDEGRERFTGFLDRFASAIRFSGQPIRPGIFAATLLETKGDANAMEQLTTLLVRTGRLRSRRWRMDLADMCLCAGVLLAEESLPDELWERWLDRRDLPPNERVRQMCAKSDALSINGLGAQPEFWAWIKELANEVLPPDGGDVI